jgi:hypothetical protein
VQHDLHIALENYNLHLRRLNRPQFLHRKTQLIVPV